MADFTRYHITNAGRKLTAKMSGQTKAIEFTKFETSDRKYDEEELQALESIESVKQTGNVNSTEYEDPYTWKIKGSVSTVELESGYFLQTVGIYAREEGEEESEILFAVTTTKDENKADWVSENGAMNTSEITFVANFVVTDANVTSIVVNADGYTPVTVFVDHQKKSTSVHGSTTQPTPNKIVERDSEGASKVKYPTAPTDDTIINKKALEDRLKKYTTDGVNISNIVNYYRDGVTYNENDVVGIETQYVNPLGQAEDVKAILFYVCLESNVTESPVGSSKWREIKTGGDLDKNFVKAEEIYYDNKVSGLEGLVGYNFPKNPQSLKSSYSGQINDGTSDFTITLTKSEVREKTEFHLTGSLQSSKLFYGDGLLLKIKTFDSSNDGLEKYLKLSQFYKFSSLTSPIFVNAESMIAITELSHPLKYAFVTMTDGDIAIFIKRLDDSPISSLTNYNITLNIKNELIHNFDTYVPYLESETKNPLDLTFVQENDIFHIVGTLPTNTSKTEMSFNSASTYLDKYFTSMSGYITTPQITSSEVSKTIDYKFSKSGSVWTMSVKHTDSSNFASGETLSIKLTPDKDFVLTPKYSPIKDVQKAIDILAHSIDTYNPDVARGRDLMKVLNARTVKEAFFRLREKASQGDFSGINLGDYIIIDKSIGEATYDPSWKEKLKVVIMAFNHYKNTYNNGNNTQNHIVLQFENISFKRRMHSGHIDRYSTTELNSYLNGTFLTELQNVIGIEPYNFYISQNNYNSTGNWVTARIWLPSQVEVFGNIGGRGFIFQTPSYVYYNAPAQLQFALYAKEPWRKTKFDANSDSRMWWWMRDVDQHTTGDFCYVDSRGGSNIHGVTNAGGVAPVFCI